MMKGPGVSYSIAVRLADAGSSIAVRLADAGSSIAVRLADAGSSIAVIQRGGIKDHLDVSLMNLARMIVA